MVRDVAFSSDGRIALTADQDEIRRWGVATGNMIDPPLRHEGNGPAMDLAFRRDGQAVLVGFDDHTARIYGTTSGKLLCPPLRHQGMVAAVAFSPDGKLAVTGSQDATARVWDVATGKPIGETLRHQGQILDVAFSPDGKTVLTAGYDDVVQLWDVASSRPIGPPWMHPIFGRFVTFSPDGKYALTLTGGDEGRNIIRLWKTPAPMPGDAERIGLWAQTLTGMELDPDDAVRRSTPRRGKRVDGPSNKLAVRRPSERRPDRSTNPAYLSIFSRCAVLRGILADAVTSVGRKIGVAVDAAGGPAHLHMIDPSRITEPEVEPGVARRLVTAASKPLG